MIMSAMAKVAAPWRTRLQRSLDENKSLAYSRYLQLATVKPDGRPANRTVVFRGFLEDGDDLTFVTDQRTHKVHELAVNPAAEVCWYFPLTREQYRIAGDLIVVGPEHTDPALQQARQAAWAKMSDGGRTQFSWPNPGEARVTDPEAFKQPAPGPTEPALSTFCLVVMRALQVDYVQLFDNNREVMELDTVSREWRHVAVNP